MGIFTFFKDKNVFLFFLNVFLVVFGYFLAIITNFQSVEIMKLLKMIVLVISIVLLFNIKNLNNLRKFNISTFVSLSIWVLVTLLWSDNISESISKFLIFIPPLFYIILFITYLNKKFGNGTSKSFLDGIFKFTYLFPIIYFVLFVRKFEASGIYGINEEAQGFVSNHYGWSASFIVLYYLTMFQNQLKAFKIIDYFIFLTSFIILVLSSNRAGLASVALALLIHIFKLKKISVKKLMFNLLVFIGISIFIYQQYTTKNSALEFMIQKSSSQIEEDSEARFIIASHSFDLFVSDFFNLFFGFGFFDDNHIIDSGFNFSSYHNSYLDIFFGIGIIGSILFLKTFYFKSIPFLRNNITQYYYVIPLLIIPYFESNTTSGQFLFFPWFSYLVFLSIQQINKNETNHPIL